MNRYVNLLTLLIVLLTFSAPSLADTVRGASWERELVNFMMENSHELDLSQAQSWSSFQITYNKEFCNFVTARLQEPIMKPTTTTIASHAPGIESE